MRYSVAVLLAALCVILLSGSPATARITGKGNVQAKRAPSVARPTPRLVARQELNNIDPSIPTKSDGGDGIVPFVAGDTAKIKKRDFELNKAANERSRQARARK